MDRVPVKGMANFKISLPLFGVKMLEVLQQTAPEAEGMLVIMDLYTGP